MRENASWPGCVWLGHQVTVLMHRGLGGDHGQHGAVMQNRAVLQDRIVVHDMVKNDKNTGIMVSWFTRHIH